MLDMLRKEVADACHMIPQYGSAVFPAGNVSAFDRENSLVVIKPLGSTCFDVTEENLLIADLSGNVVEGSSPPSPDLAAHIELYRAFPEIGGIVHTHSRCATARAQAGRDIPPYGMTHAGYFRGYIPCTRSLTSSEIEEDYEKNIGLSIVETFEKRGFNPNEIPGVLVFNHGPYTWGIDCFEALQNAIVLENIADLAYQTEQINPEILPISDNILDKQFLKHRAFQKNQV